MYFQIVVVGLVLAVQLFETDAFACGNLSGCKQFVFVHCAHIHGEGLAIGRDESHSWIGFYLIILSELNVFRLLGINLNADEMLVEIAAYLIEREYGFGHSLAWNAPYGVEIDKKNFVFFLCLRKRLVEITIEENDSFRIVSFRSLLCLCSGSQGDENQKHAEISFHLRIFYIMVGDL